METGSTKQGENLAKQGENLLKQGEHALKQGQEKIKSVVSDVDEKLHENPWPYLSGVALGFLLLGFLMGGGSRRGM